jgi:hypothetical protein
VRARAAALTEDLAENFEGRKAMQVTYYEPEPQFRVGSSAPNRRPVRGGARRAVAASC